MRVVAIVQARLGSSRLPAKILLDLGGKTALERCLERVAQFEGVAEVLVATTREPADDLVVAVARRAGFAVSRGETDDVLSRYVEAARAAKADAVVRCTSDCPLLDPALSSAVVQAMLASDAAGKPLDYASNGRDRRLPLGLDTEIVSMSALSRAHGEATAPSDREHVTLYVHRRPELFKVHSVLPPFSEDYSAHRWTLDTIDDYRLIATIFDRLGPSASRATLHDALRLFDEDPTLSSINAHVKQKVA